MKLYVKPQVVLHGSVENLTQANKTGTILDSCFCAGTPVSEVTLS